MLKAVGAMHAAGVSHGHLTPESFVWDEHGVHVVSRDGAPVVSASGDGEFTVSMTQACPLDPLQVESSRAPRRMETALWYRAPEVLVQGVAEVLSCSEGSSSAHAVDMWAMGVILAEMVTGAPLFGSAETTFDLLSLHCDCLGYSFSSDDLEIISPYDAEDNEMDASTRPSLRKMITADKFCEHGFDFMSQLLSCDWKLRPAALQALDHPFLVQCSCNPSRAGKRAREDESESVCVEEDWGAPAHLFPSFSSPESVGPLGSDGGLLSSPLPSELQVLLAERRRKRAAPCPAKGPGSMAKKARLIDLAPAPIPCGPPFDPEALSC